MEEQVGISRHPFPLRDLPEDTIESILDLYTTSWNSKKVVEFSPSVNTELSDRINHGVAELDHYYTNGGRRCFTSIQENAYQELMEQFMSKTRKHA